MQWVPFWSRGGRGGGADLVTAVVVVRIATRIYAGERRGPSTGRTGKKAPAGSSGQG